MSAAKSLKEAMYRSNIDIELKKAICIGELWQLKSRIDRAEEVIIQNVRNELRDYLAHRIMILGEGASLMDLFEEVFGGRE